MEGKRGKGKRRAKLRAGFLLQETGGTGPRERTGSPPQAEWAVGKRGGAWSTQCTSSMAPVSADLQSCTGCPFPIPKGGLGPQDCRS